MAFRLRLLGEPVIQAFDGGQVEFPIGKPMALVSFLTLEGREVGRDELASLLWPTSPPERARHSVRQAIWMIRRNLGEGAIEGDDPVRSTVISDVDGFREALAEGNLEAARGLWNGPLLRGLTLPDCRQWERWREEKQEVLGVGFFRALFDSATGLTNEGKAEEALDLLGEALNLNPFSLDARLLLVENLLSLRRLPAARLALEEARQRGHGSADAGERLARLEGRMKAALEKDKATEPRHMGESRTFVGRAGELLDLVGLWKRVRTGYSGSACIVGPTGIGKTRLASEFLADVEEEGGRVAQAKGYRGEHRIPLGTVTDLVRQLMHLPGAKGIGSGSDAVLRSVLPSLRGNGPERNAAGVEAAYLHVHPAALADAVTDLVEAVAFEVPVAVFLDDWQWVDRESRALMGKVARRVRGLPCLFLFSERTQQRRQWVETAEDLVRDLGGRLIFLGPLREGELLDLIVNLVELSDPGRAGDLAARIHWVTGGNPLFVAEVLRKLADDGASRLEQGRWVLDVDGVPESLDLPESVQELVRERLERLSTTGTRIVATLAGERRSVPARLLRRHTGLEEAAFNQGLHELIAQEIVDWTEAKHLDFTHDQLREAAGRFLRIRKERYLAGWASERPGWVSLGLLGMVASLAFLISTGSRVLPSLLGGEETPVATYPFGAGKIVVLGDPMMEVIPPAWEGGEWAVRESSLWMPALPPVQIDGPFRTPDHELRWFGDVWGSEEPPYAVELVPALPPMEYFVWSGDVGFQDLAPDGREGLLLVEDLEAEVYAQDLIRVSEGGEVVVVYAGEDVLRGADWSPDGQRIVLSAAGPADTILILSPTGEVVHREAMTRYRGVARPKWCGDSRHFVAQGSRGAPPFGLLMTDAGSVIREFGEPLLSVEDPVCVGDARGAVFVGTGGDGSGLFFLDFETDSLTLLRDLSLGGSRRVVWLPDEAEPPIWAIEIVQDDQALEWSESRGLEAIGRRSNGDPEAIHVEWESSDPSVVAVSSEGVVTGNRAGTAQVYARHSQWLCDSVTVRVLEPISVPREVLFRETFQDPDLPDWFIPEETVPKPAVVQREGEPALLLNGDGRYMDFIWSRGGFSLQHGTTLEVEFRLPVSRKDKQRIGSCLEELPQSETWAPHQPTEARLCFQYPSGENAKRRDDLALVTVGQSRWGYEVDASAYLPTENWVHLAMTVRPDGRVAVFLNREIVFLSEQTLAILPDRAWRVKLSGSSVDTELLVRNLTVWRGERPGFEPG